MNFESRVAHFETAFLQGRVLHLGRERMRHRAAQNAQAYGWTKFLTAPVLEIGEAAKVLHDVARYSPKERRFPNRRLIFGGARLGRAGFSTRASLARQSLALPTIRLTVSDRRSLG